MRIIRHIAAALAGFVVAVPAQAAIFSFEFAFPFTGIADIPGSTELASNQFVTTQVSVLNPARLSLYRLRQENSDALLGGLPPMPAEVDLFLGANRFEVDDQAFSLAGQLIGSFTFSGGFITNLGYAFEDGGTQFFYYPDLPFRFYVDASATYDGIGPYTGGSDVIYFALPGDDGLYRLQAAVPEPSTWAMMILGFAAAGAAVRRRRDMSVGLAR